MTYDREAWLRGENGTTYAGISGFTKERGDTMNTHTPGPWASDEMIHNMMEFRIYSSAGKIIARVQDFTTFREDVEQAEANAALIAAAPAMLEVLKNAIHDGRLQTFEDRERFRTAAREAIRLAEGRG